jgi:hypothetical protein
MDTKDSIKHQIAEIIEEPMGVDEYNPSSKKAGKTLSLIREEIKKVENPYHKAQMHWHGFELCREKILKKMEEK